MRFGQLELDDVIRILKLNALEKRQEREDGIENPVKKSTAWREDYQTTHRKRYQHLASEGKRTSIVVSDRGVSLSLSHSWSNVLNVRIHIRPNQL